MKCHDRVVDTQAMPVFAVLLFSVFSVFSFASDPLLAGEGDLRSAFLGPSRWTGNLSPRAVNRELQSHFAEVVRNLERDTEQSLRDSLQLLESNHSESWTKEFRAEKLRQLRANRAVQISRLREYAANGRFPINDGQAADAVPIFVDQRGTHCAVGYLMHRDGCNQQIANIVQANNLVFVTDVQSGGLVDWVQSSGLTQKEAAVIQPGYPPHYQVTLEEMQTTTSFTRQGYTISGLQVSEVEYASNFNDAWSVGRTLVDNSDSSVVPYHKPDDFGLILAVDEYEVFDGSDTREWHNVHDQWMFFGSSFGMGLPVDPANAMMFKIDYDIVSNTGPITDLALTSMPGDITGINNNHIAFGGPDADLRALSVFYDVNDNVVAELELQTYREDMYPFFAGTVTDVANHEQLRVETYALTFDRALLGSLVHEFSTVSPGDFDSNGAYEPADIDALVAEIAAGTDDELYDLTGDLIVNGADLNAWLIEAGSVLNSNGGAFLPGDANLDGFVDVGDFNLWNTNKFTNAAAWSSGDFNADGVIDVGDFNKWNTYKFTESGDSIVPEPSSWLMALVACLPLLFRKSIQPSIRQ